MIEKATCSVIAEETEYDKNWEQLILHGEYQIMNPSQGMRMCQ